MSAPSSIIRPARPAEAAAAQALARAAYQHYVPRMGREPAPMLADYGELIAAGEVFLLEREGRLLGLIVLRSEDDALFVENIAVDRAAQGQGHGRALMGFAESEARRRGTPLIRLYTNIAMTENLDFYPRLGFRETGRRVEDGYHRVYFEKPVPPSVETDKAGLC